MSEGAVEIGDRMRWNHTAGIMGLIHNVNYKKPVGFDHYNPYTKTKKTGTVIKAANISDLKALAGLDRVKNG